MLMKFQCDAETGKRNLQFLYFCVYVYALGVGEGLGKTIKHLFK